MRETLSEVLAAWGGWRPAHSKSCALPAAFTDWTVGPAASSCACRIISVDAQSRITVEHGAQV